MLIIPCGADSIRLLRAQCRMLLYIVYRAHVLAWHLNYSSAFEHCSWSCRPLEPWSLALADSELISPAVHSSSAQVRPRVAPPFSTSGIQSSAFELCSNPFQSSSALQTLYLSVQCIRALLKLWAHTHAHARDRAYLHLYTYATSMHACSLLRAGEVCERQPVQIQSRQQ